MGIAQACPRKGCGHGGPSLMTLDKTLMPVPDGHPAVFERSWPLRVGDIDRSGRLRLDAAARLVQDIGQDHVHALGFDKTHPVGVVRRTMAVDRFAAVNQTNQWRRSWSGTKAVTGSRSCLPTPDRVRPSSRSAKAFARATRQKTRLRRRTVGDMALMLTCWLPRR